MQKCYNVDELETLQVKMQSVYCASISQLYDAVDMLKQAVITHTQRCIAAIRKQHDQNDKIIEFDEECWFTSHEQLETCIGIIHSVLVDDDTMRPHVFDTLMAHDVLCRSANTVTQSTHRIVNMLTRLCDDIVLFDDVIRLRLCGVDISKCVCDGVGLRQFVYGDGNKNTFTIRCCDTIGDVIGWLTVDDISVRILNVDDNIDVFSVSIDIDNIDDGVFEVDYIIGDIGLKSLKICVAVCGLNVLGSPWIVTVSYVLCYCCFL